MDDKQKSLREISLFTGAGGGILAADILGWQTICAVEREVTTIATLVRRQNEGLIPSFPIWNDITTFDGCPWRGYADVVSGGFPCQNISTAGKGEGITGDRSSLWKEQARIISEVRPKFCFVENSPALRTRGLEVVIEDLVKIGYNTQHLVLGASEVGSRHKRERIWIRGVLGDSHDDGQTTC